MIIKEWLTWYAEEVASVGTSNNSHKNLKTTYTCSHVGFTLNVSTCTKRIQKNVYKYHLPIYKRGNETN
jgi:hypothetical protein